MDVTLRSDDIKGIRQAGARFGADMILIVDGVAGIDRYNNYLAWLYPTLIGAYLVPGSESDALVMATGSLWAIRSNWHALLPTVEERSKAVGAAAFLADTWQTYHRAAAVTGHTVTHQKLAVPAKCSELDNEVGEKHKLIFASTVIVGSCMAPTVIITNLWSYDQLIREPMGPSDGMARIHGLEPCSLTFQIS
jgi:hypothetical protein